MEEAAPKPSLAKLLDHFAEIEDPREPWRVMHPLPEVFLVLVCGTIADCDDFEGISDWANEHLSFLRRFSEFYHGVPGPRWLNILLNRVGPETFARAFQDWAQSLRADAPDLVALDGKTLRGSHDRPHGQSPLHLVSAFATREKLVLGQEAVAPNSNETTAIPALLARLGEAGSLTGSLVTIDAIACTEPIAREIQAAGADYLLAVKSNQPNLRDEIAEAFQSLPAESLDSATITDKGHGRLEHRHIAVTRETTWLNSDDRYPEAPRLPNIATIAQMTTEAETKSGTRRETRYYASSRALTAQEFGEAVRHHWHIENSLHWVLDVVFKEDLNRTRTGHATKNMAVVRHFAFNLLRQVNDKRALKRRRKMAGWNLDYLQAILTGVKTR